MSNSKNRRTTKINLSKDNLSKAFSKSSIASNLKAKLKVNKTETSVFRNFSSGKSSMSNINNKFYKTQGIGAKILKTMPRNVNEYKHLMCDSSINLIDLTWTLNLRGNPDKANKSKTIETSNNPPSFFEEDLEKLIQKKKISDPTATCLYSGPNTFKLNHLVYKNHVPIDHSILAFESSLRNFTLKAPLDNPNKNNKWKNLAYKPRDISYLRMASPITEKAKEFINRNETNLWRGFQTCQNKEEYLSARLIKKKVVPDKNSALPYLGEHFSLKHYDQNYKEKNIQKIRHILNRQCTNSLANFEIGLRSYSSNTGKEPEIKHNIHRKK